MWFLSITVTFFLLSALTVSVDSRCDANPTTGSAQPQPAPGNGGEEIRNPEVPIDQSNSFGNSGNTDNTGATTADNTGNDYVSEGNKNLSDGKKDKNQMQQALGAMQALQGLLSKLAAMKLAQTGAQSNAKQNSMSSITGPTDAQGDTNSSYSNSKLSGSSPSVPTRAQTFASLNQGQLGQALSQIQTNYGISPSQAFNALDKGVSPQNLLSNAPQNAPSSAELKQLATGMAMYGGGQQKALGITNPPPSTPTAPTDAFNRDPASQEFHYVVAADGTRELKSFDEAEADEKIGLANTKLARHAVGTKDWEGTVSVLQTGQGTAPMTDQHVNLKFMGGLEPGIDIVSDIRGQSDGNVMKFTNESFDKRMDLAMAKETSNMLRGSGAPVALLGTEPTVGESAKMFGQPDIFYGGTKTIMMSTFKGLYLNPNGTVEYLYDAPTNGDFVGGMSGGLVMHNGQVVGLLKSHSYETTYNGVPSELPMYGRVVHVTPVAQDANGNLIAGKTWDSAHGARCFGPNSISGEPSSCEGMVASLSKSADPSDSEIRDPVYAIQQPTEISEPPHAGDTKTSGSGGRTNGLSYNRIIETPPATRGQNYFFPIRFSFLPFILRSAPARQALQNIPVRRCLPQRDVLASQEDSVSPGSYSTVKTVVPAESSFGVKRYSLICQAWPRDYVRRSCEGKGAACVQKFETSYLSAVGPNGMNSVSMTLNAEKTAGLRETAVARWQSVVERFSHFSFRSTSTSEATYHSLQCFSQNSRSPAECFATPLGSSMAGSLSALFGDPMISDTAGSSNRARDASQVALAGAAFCALGAEVNRNDAPGAAPYYAECQRDLTAAKGILPDGLALSADQTSSSAEKVFTDFQNDFGISKEQFLKLMFGPAGGISALSAMLGDKVSPAMLAQAMKIATDSLPNEPPHDKDHFLQAFTQAAAGHAQDEAKLESLWKLKSEVSATRKPSSQEPSGAAEGPADPSLFDTVSAKYTQIRVVWQEQSSSGGRPGFWY